MSDPPLADEEFPQPSRYVVGIDLGTTNSALCYVDTDAEPWSVQTFPVLQWVEFGEREQRETLPSFHYELTPGEASGTDLRLPWQSEAAGECVGILARDAGQRHPGRRIASAKSWLSHDGVDRSADFLPWHGEADVDRMSPVEASARYLAHLRAAWDDSHPNDPLDQQDVILTLPASFDEVARELTIAAAKRAGLPRVYLIEEPQAAFYAWIDRQGDAWQQVVRPGQLILVCDIGGGTTDLTLIRVRPAGEQSGQVQFHRVAVGRHLILGGDNLDLAIAKFAEAKLAQRDSSEPSSSTQEDERTARRSVPATEGSNEPLSPTQWDRLVLAARQVKETMLTGGRPESYTIHLPAEGARLIGGGVQIEVTAEEVDWIVLDGFFPQVELNEIPVAGQSGFQEFGLPYAADPAVTRHLAAFLSTHRRSGLDEAESDAEDRPELVLFNGGVMAAPAIRDRVVEALSRWFTRPEETAWRPQVLDSPRLDLAVGHGAAYYGMVRRGEGVRIAANLGRSYYMQVEDDPPRGICLIPGSAEAGQRFRAGEHPLELQIGAPVQFPLWVSSTRLADPVGELVTLSEGEASPLPPICTALVRGRRRDEATLRVVIEAELSEIGTVGLYCVEVDSGRRWRLEFDIRSTLETDREAHAGAGERAGIVDAETVQRCEEAIAEVFAQQSGGKPGRLVKKLQSITETSRHRWPPSLLRELWQFLIDHEPGRRQSPAHEARWLNLTGYCLRPGYGMAVDDWRVGQTWRMVYGKLAFPASQSRTESMILWRRIAGGLTGGQQQQLAAPLAASLRGKAGRLEPHEATETWRLVASLERLAPSDKINLGKLALSELPRKKNEKLRPALLWALGRLGTRQPAYGPLNTAVPPDQVSDWIDTLVRLDLRDRSLPLALVQLARRTGDRFRDLPEPARVKAAERVRFLEAPEHHATLITEGGQLESEEEEAIFGDALPLGIRLVRG